MSTTSRAGERRKFVNAWDSHASIPALNEQD
ncbi:hypothetical protein PI124_g22363 [Phytophthora idaei]|nr:hypothetical protein PI124_g22363 [Phytophthora idaei]